MNPDELALPYLTRDMLDFKHSASFSLILEHQSYSATTLLIIGATKSGTFTFKAINDGTRAINTTKFGIPDVPIWVSIIDSVSTNVRGESFAKLSLGINGDKVQQLCAGYLYGIVGVSWPQTNLNESNPGMGKLITLKPANPAQGQPVIITVPSNAVYKLRQAFIIGTTSAIGGTDTVYISAKNGDGTRAIQTIGTYVQAAGVSFHYGLVAGAPSTQVAAQLIATMQIPDNLILGPGGIFMIGWVTNGGPGGSFSEVEVLVEEWLT